MNLSRHVPRSLARLAVLAVASGFIPLIAAPAHALVGCVLFTGANNGEWSVGSNWTGNAGSPPNSSQCADLNGNTVQVSTGTNVAQKAINGSLSVLSGSLKLGDGTAETSTLTSLLVTAGTFDGDALQTVNVSGDITWTGQMTGSSSIGASGLAITQPASQTFTINGSGSATLAGGSITTGSPISITNPSFVTSGTPQVTTTSTISFPTAVTTPANGGAHATWTAAGVTVGTTGDYGFSADNLVLTGGTTTIPAGSFLHAGTVSVTGGTLANVGPGTSTVSGNLTVTGGTVDPGGANATAQLFVTGNYSFSGSAQQRVDTTDSGNFDAVDPSGTAVLNGGSFVITTVGAYTPAPGTRLYPIIGHNSGTLTVTADPSTGGASTHFFAGHDTQYYWLTAYAAETAPDGSIFYSHDDISAGARQIVRRDADGTTSVVEPDGYDPQLSPDGSWLVFKRGTGAQNGTGDSLYSQHLTVGPTSDMLLFNNSDYIVDYDISPNSATVLFDYSCGIYTVPIVGGSTTVVGGTAGGCYADAPKYNPTDAGEFAFHSSNGTNGIFTSNGTTATAVSGTGLNDFDPTWSPDGTKLAFEHLGAQVGATSYYAFDEYVIDATGGTPTKVTTMPGEKLFSPGFRWTADGKSLVGAARFHGADGIWRLSTDASQNLEPELIDDTTTGGSPQSASAMKHGSYVASSFPLTLAGGAPAQAFHLSVANDTIGVNSFDEVALTITDATTLTATQVHVTYDNGSGSQPLTLSDGPTGITGTIELPGGIGHDAVRTTPMTVSLDAAAAQHLHVELARLGDSDPVAPASEQGTATGAATATATDLTVPATAPVGTPVDLTATVSVPGMDPVTPPDGTVQFQDSGAALGSPVTLVAGVATLTTSSLAPGDHPITAVYSGSVASSYATSTSAIKTVTITVPATVPGAPGVTAQRGNKQAVLTVTPPASNGGAAIDHYTITLTPGPITKTVTATGATTVTGLTNGVAYSVSVTAHNSVGDGPAGTTSVTPAAVPDAPVASSVTAGNASIALAFSTPANNGSPITDYTVTATPLDAVSGSGKVVHGAGSPITVTGLTNGAAYSLVVHATNAVGDGPNSAPIIGVAGIAKGVSLLLSKNPVPVGHPLQFYGYVVNHSAPVANQVVSLQQRLSKTKTNVLAKVKTDAQGRFTYSLRLVHTGAVRASAVIEGVTTYSKELLAKVAFVLLKVKATIKDGHIVITGFITPGSPSPFGEAPDRVAIYRSNAAGAKLAYIGDAKLATTAKGASKTGFTYDHASSVLHGSTYVYVNPLGTRANWSTHVSVKVK